jgi:GR25 family glycosyltransferase involved in LPS biosynthesis
MAPSESCNYESLGGRGLEKQRILVVEDDVSFREVFKRAIGDALAAELLDVAFVGAGSISEARPAAGSAACSCGERTSFTLTYSPVEDILYD